VLRLLLLSLITNYQQSDNQSNDSLKSISDHSVLLHIIHITAYIFRIQISDQAAYNIPTAPHWPNAYKFQLSSLSNFQHSTRCEYCDGMQYQQTTSIDTLSPLITTPNVQITNMTIQNIGGVEKHLVFIKMNMKQKTKQNVNQH